MIAHLITTIPAVLFFLAAQPRLRARIRKMEYLQHRLALVSSILSTHRDLLRQSQIAAMEGEINFITSELLASSSQSGADRIREWNRQVRWRRFLTLPKPVSRLDWIATVMFYLYLIVAATYFLIFWPIALLSPEPAIQNLAVLLMSILSFVFCAFVRDWRLRTATNTIAP